MSVYSRSGVNAHDKAVFGDMFDNSGINSVKKPLEMHTTGKEAMEHMMKYKRTSAVNPNAFRTHTKSVPFKKTTTTVKFQD